MDSGALSDTLALAGLSFLGMVDFEDAFIPPNLATFVSSCSPEDEVINVAVDLNDPELCEKINVEWYELARQCGLLSGIGSQFLVAVNIVGRDAPWWWWARVELLNEWDIAGAGAASGLLGTGACRPSFVMLSLDGEAVLRCDVGEAFVDLTAVREPHRARTLWRHGEWMVGWPRTDEFTRAALERWLSSHG